MVREEQIIYFSIKRSTYFTPKQCIGQVPGTVRLSNILLKQTYTGVYMYIQYIYSALEGYVKLVEMLSWGGELNDRIALHPDCK